MKQPTAAGYSRENVDWFNNTRLYEENGDIPPVKLEQAYYRQHRPSALGRFTPESPEKSGRSKAAS